MNAPFSRESHGSAAANVGWGDLADLAFQAPTVVRAQVTKVQRVSRRQAPDLAPGMERLLVEVQLEAAIRAPGLLPPRGAWLFDRPATGRGGWPARGDRVLAFATTASGTDPEMQMYRLVSPRAQIAWSAEREADVRDIVRAVLDPANQGMMVTHIADGFHTQGTIPGNSESQFFLSTEGGRPMTLTVTRTPDAPPQVRLATGEMIDMGKRIEPKTLAWHALACGLPDDLPAQLRERPGLVDDYIIAKAAIGECSRRF